MDFARREEQLLEAQKRYGFEKITKRYADLLEDPEVDVIDLCTPPYMHAEEAILALNHGKHVICENRLPDILETMMIWNWQERFRRKKCIFLVLMTSTE